MNSRTLRYLVISLLVLAAFFFRTPAIMGMQTVSADGVRIAGLMPPDLSADVAVTSPITIEFSGPGVNQSFYQTISLGLFQGSRTVDGEMFYNPNTRQVMFKPSGKLNDGQTYTAQLSFRDAQGNPVEKIWSFRTSGAAQAMSQSTFTEIPSPGNDAKAFLTAPAPAAPSESLKISRAPMAHSTVSGNTPLELTFSEPLDLSTLKDAPIKLFQGKQQQGVDYKLSKDLRTVSLVPRNTLNPGEGYNIVIQPQLAGSSGARLPKNTLIPFKVQAFAAKEESAVPDYVVEESPPEEGSAESYETPSFSSGPQSSRPARMSPPDLPPSLPSTPPLKVVGLTPRNGDIIQNNNQPISIAFNTEVRPETLNEFTFRLEDDFGPVPARIKYFPGKKQAVLTPIGILDSAKTYRVILTKGVTDPYGQTIQTPLNSTFSVTGSQARRQANPFSDSMAAAPRKPVLTEDYAGDSRELEGLSEEFEMPKAPAAPVRQATAPAKRPASKANKLSAFRVQAITPTFNAQNVSRSSKIFIRFNEPVDPGTVDAINISVFGNQRRVEGHVTYDRQKYQAVFIPKERLAATTQYTVVINDKIKSVSGEGLVGRYTWQFLTNSETRNSYQPMQASARLDTSFSIPLIDRKKTQQPVMARTAADNASQGPSFSYLPANHWVFKTIRHITSKGMLTTYPFNHNTKISRYECAMSIKVALENLKGMATTPGKPRLRLADLVHLENLVVEFRPELRSFGTDTIWFENFLQGQGVDISEIESRVQNQGQG